MAVFPSLAFGGSVFLPYIRRFDFLTAKEDMETGLRFAYYWRASALLLWTIQYTNLSDADLSTIVTFFNSMYGSYGEFTFTDPENLTAYTKVRFGSDQLAVNHQGPNQSALSVVLVQYA